MAYTEREVAEIARVVTDKPYTWREEDGRLVIVTRDAEFEVVDPAPADKSETDEAKDAEPAKAASKGTGASRKAGKAAAPTGVPTVQQPALVGVEPAAQAKEAALPSELELELMSKTRLLALAHERGIKATRRWTCFEIRQALLQQQVSEVEKKTSEIG